MARTGLVILEQDHERQARLGTESRERSLANPRDQLAEPGSADPDIPPEHQEGEARIRRIAACARLRIIGHLPAHIFAPERQTGAGGMRMAGSKGDQLQRLSAIGHQVSVRASGGSPLRD